MPAGDEAESASHEVLRSFCTQLPLASPRRPSSTRRGRRARAHQAATASRRRRPAAKQPTSVFTAKAGLGRFAAPHFRRRRSCVPLRGPKERAGRHHIPRGRSETSRPAAAFAAPAPRDAYRAAAARAPELTARGPSTRDNEARRQPAALPVRPKGLSAPRATRLRRPSASTSSPRHLPWKNS